MKGEDSMHDVFYFTDVHGCYDLYRAAMTYCFAKDEAPMIIYGGDACDRGPDGYRIMNELLDNPQVVYLKGNHEELFVNAAYEIMSEYHGNLDADEIFRFFSETKDTNSSLYWHIYNGGCDTLYDWMMDGMSIDFVRRIEALPITFTYGELDFCHAGGRYTNFVDASYAEYEWRPVDNKDFMMLVWDRNYLGQGWQEGRTCIFGHTPTTHLPAKYYGRDKSIANIHPCAYYATLDDRWPGRKIAMDTGAFASGKLYVLNCLTMQAQGFLDKEIQFRELRNHRIEEIERIQF